MMDSGKATAWVIPVAGGAPVQLDPALHAGPGFSPSSLRIHPDGRRVAFTAGERASEIWTLENFLPVAAPRK